MKMNGYYLIILGILLMREDLLNNWGQLKKDLEEINSATSYIEPRLYELALRIKKSEFALTIELKKNPLKNKDLEAWSPAIYKLYLLDIELKELIDNEKNAI